MKTFFVLLLVCISALIAENEAYRGLRAVSSAGFSTFGRPKLNEVISRGASHVLSWSALEQDVAVSTAAIGGTVAWLQIWISLARSGKIDSKLSRKIIHAGSAPIFMLLWPLYSGSPNSRYFAAGVVGLQVLRLVYAGTKTSSQAYEIKSAQKGGLAGGGEGEGEGGREGGLAGAISRSGDKREALQVSTSKI